ncbi:MAG: DUF2946 family protein [Comamonas sp.]
MDDIVKQALTKWPNVPDCWGWLGLDVRGNWWLRDAQAQAQGTFAQSKGALLEHEKLKAFIGRNYEVNAQGHWFFQNGPQRVYVELENTPMVWRVHADGRVVAHTNQPAQQVQQCLVDEVGHVYLLCDGVLGIVHTQDMVHVADALEKGRWTVQEVMMRSLPERFGFVRSPQALSTAAP